MELLVLLLLLIGLPLAGVLAAGKPLAPYLEFPPRTRYVEHAPFSWLAFVGLIAIGIVVLTPFCRRLTSCRRQAESDRNLGVSFPAWGWSAIGCLLLSWGLAWTRCAWFEPLQKHTFIPLWFSYVVVVNALAYRRAGHCLLLDNPRAFLLLFPVSAGFWWFFEFLNRFVHNWYYLAAESYTRSEYIFFASISFSTVLPAVYSTRQWLLTYAVIREPYRDYPRLPCRDPRAPAWAMLALSVVTLAWIGVYPDYFSPFLWLSPGFVVLSVRLLRRPRAPVNDLFPGVFDNMVSWSLAALVCGFFWELWNYYSLAKWEYSVPFVHRFQVFEMPILGYLGYLPFGIECGLLVSAIFSLPGKETHWTRT